MSHTDSHNTYRACTVICAVTMLLITAVLGLSMLAGPIVNAAVERFFAVRMFTMDEWRDCCLTVGIVALAVLYAPLGTMLAVYWHRSKAPSQDKEDEWA